MGKIEEMEGVVEEVEDIVDDSDEELEEVEGGIFDEDFDEDLEYVEEAEGVSDFNIGTTILTVASPVESWAGQNLEEAISRERVEKDWGDDNTFEDGGVYKASSDSTDVYGPAANDVYSSSGGDRGAGVYAEAGGAYDTAKGGTYSSQGANVGGLKSHDQVNDERRGSSMLESLGFEDKKKRSHDKFASDFVAYEGKDAA